MNKKLSVALIVIFLLVSIGVIQYSKNGIYHCGRCGSERWVFNILFFDLGDRDFDEFGIEERWVSAHQRPCEHIWLRGPLESDDGVYWPPLHSKIARSGDWETILLMMKSASDVELKRKDALGRTVLHWLAVYPNLQHRQMLIDLAVSRGLSWDDKDSDGLTPRDWSNIAQKAPQ